MIVKTCDKDPVMELKDCSNFTSKETWFVLICQCLTSTDGAGGLEKDTVNFVASLETALNVIPEKKRRLQHQHSCPFKRVKK